MATTGAPLRSATTKRNPLASWKSEMPLAKPASPSAASRAGAAASRIAIEDAASARAAPQAGRAFGAPSTQAIFASLRGLTPAPQRSRPGLPPAHAECTARFSFTPSQQRHRVHVDHQRRGGRA
jgi:hypothetical protein